MTITLTFKLWKLKLSKITVRFKNSVTFMMEYPRFKASCRRARQASEVNNNRRFYSMKLCGKYYEFCRDDINGLKCKGIMRKDLTFLDIQKYSCYQTK